MKKKIQKYLSGEREGFSLIELIIVIAIMAILIGVIALVVLPYLESARENRDRQTLSEVSNAFKSAMADEATAKEITTDASWHAITTVSGGNSATLSDGSAYATLAKKMEQYMDGSLADAGNRLASDACKEGVFEVKVDKDANDKYKMSVRIKKGSATAEDSNGNAYEQ